MRCLTEKCGRRFADTGRKYAVFFFNEMLIDFLFFVRVLLAKNSYFLVDYTSAPHPLPDGKWEYNYAGRW